jgi:hypothetical protein
MSAGEGISGNSLKRRGSEDRRVLRKIFDSAYSPNLVEGEFSEVELGCPGPRPLGHERQYVRLEFVWYEAISDAPTSRLAYSDQQW